MTPEKRPPYLKLPQDFFDLSASAAFSAVPLLVYLHIRRYVWRSGLRRGDFQPKPSQVVAYVNQSALGGAVGINRQNVSLHIAKLERLKWLRRLNTSGDKTERVYELGFKAKGVGEDAEVYFADQCLAAFRKKVGGDALKEMNAEAKGEALRAHFESPLVSPERQGLSRQKDKACLARKTRLVSPARHQNRQRGNSQRGNSQSAKPLRGAFADAQAERSLRSRSAASPAMNSKRDRNSPPPPVPRDPSSRKKKGGKVNRFEMNRAVEVAAKAKTDKAMAAKAEKRAQKEKNLAGVPGSKGSPIRRLYDVWYALVREQWPDLPEEHIGKWWSLRERSDGTVERRALKEAGQCQMLVKKYSESAVECYFKYAVSNWGKLRERLKKAPMIPTVGFLLAISDTLVPESALVARAKSAEDEVEAWCRENPGKNPPADMLARLRGQTAGG
jgi:DNA-binding MarR family transcriptional regulator